jgi:hypothetical protein
MTSLPQWVAKVSASWTAIGVLLIVLANQSGIPVPDFLLKIFSQTFVDAVVTAGSAVIVFYQFVRAIFARNNSAEVSALGADAKVKFLLNPFKLKP